MPNTELADTLEEAVRRHRPLTAEERRTLKQLVSDRVRELVPYTEAQEAGIDYRIARRTAKTTGHVSARERDVLIQVMLGKTDPEIAQELEVSAHTIKTHVKHVLEKLGAKNRVHAAVIVFASALTGNGDLTAGVEGVASLS